MQQALLARQELYESTIRHDRFHGTFIFFTYFRLHHNAFYPGHCLVYVRFVGREYFYHTFIIYFIYADGSACFALYFLNDLTTRAYHGTYLLTVDDDLLDAW